MLGRQAPGIRSCLVPDAANLPFNSPFKLFLDKPQSNGFQLFELYTHSDDDNIHDIHPGTRAHVFAIPKYYSTPPPSLKKDLNSNKRKTYQRLPSFHYRVPLQLLKAITLLVPCNNYDQQCFLCVLQRITVVLASCLDHPFYNYLLHVQSIGLSPIKRMCS